MVRARNSEMTLRELARLRNPGRREFIRNILLGGGGIVLFNGLVVKKLAAQAQDDKLVYSMVVVDFNKCTGCRTCETACSASNHKVLVGGKELPGLGNPYLSNIRVYPFNPDVDVPVTCLMCEDAPCIAACPVEPDPKTGWRALYREKKGLPIIRHDNERCIGCGSCAEACGAKRVGAIIPNPATNRPERLCTLCGGDPQCVKYCPYGALSHIVDGVPGKYYGFSANEVAKALAELWYGQK